MIGFVLGTSEGKEILSLMNEFTEDIVVSTATKYGGDLLKDYKINYINSEPLDKKGFIELIRRFSINIFVDASHPYAKEVSNTVMEACEESDINYVRYERKSFLKDMNIEGKVIKIEDYNQLKDVLKDIDGVVLNTTGSNNVKAIMDLNLKNRVIHMILPSSIILKKVIDDGIDIGDIIAAKGPFGYHFNEGIIKEYDIKALITKDSGIEGGLKDKIEAAFNNNVHVIVIERPKIDYGITFDDIKDLVTYLKDKFK